MYFWVYTPMTLKFSFKNLDLVTLGKIIQNITRDLMNLKHVPKKIIKKKQFIYTSKNQKLVLIFIFKQNAKNN